MKLKDDYVLYNARENETIAVAVGDEAKVFKGLLRANETASFILNCLKEETSEDEIVEKIKKEYNADEELLRKDLMMVIEKLRSIKALEE